MQNKTLRFLIFGAVAIAPVGAAHATPIAFTGAYSQNFDTLVGVSPNASTTFNLVPAGFEYAQNTTLGASSNPPGSAGYRVGSGSSQTGALYSFGDDGSTERAFGSLASGATGTLNYGFGFTNTSGQTLNNLRINYSGEQWRKASRVADPQSLSFGYRTGAQATDNILTGAYTNFSALDFVSPTLTGTATALDGNAAANRRLISANITGLSIANNETFWVRWTDIDDAPSDHGLAIDNFSISSDVNGVAPVPELSTRLLLALGMGALGLFQLAARKRKSAAGLPLSGNLAL